MTRAASRPWPLAALYALALGLALCFTAGCDRPPAPNTRVAAIPEPGGFESKPSGPQTAASMPFSILAGSELKPLAPAILAAAQAQGLHLRIEYAGTLDAVERIAAGEPHAALLPPNGAYPSLVLGARVLAHEKLFYSRIVLGVKPAVVRALGWDRQPPAWTDIAAAAGAGRLRFAMTSPVASNSGMSALFAVAAAAAGKTEDLQPAEIDGRVLRAFMHGQALTAGSSGWLAEAWARESAGLDAMVNYESVILQLDATLPADERLQLVYPRDGVISADYPLLLLDGRRQDEYRRLVALLKSAPFQSTALAAAFLRPSNPDATAAAALPVVTTAELGFPNRLDVIDAVLAACQRDWRRPATSIFVLDTSGSMRGARIEALREALRLLAGSDAAASASDRYARFQPQERAILIRFSDTVEPAQLVRFDSAAPGAAQAEVLRYAAALRAEGGTALYEALDVAERLAIDERRRDPQRLVSILLLTDGVSTVGLDEAGFAARYREAAPVRVFPILFGEGSADAMQALATLTGGRIFDGRRDALTRVFREIRGYQ